MQPKELTAVFSQNLKRLREMAGLSQNALAKKIGNYAPYISDLERGVRNPTMETIAKLSEALDTPPGALLDQPKKKIRNAS